MWVDNISNSDIWLDSWWVSPSLSESAKEQFSDNIKKWQKAAKQQKVAELKAKQYDDTLASVLTSMLSWGDCDFLVILISNLIDNNVPSDFILAILSISNVEAEERVVTKTNEWGVYEFWEWWTSLINYGDNEFSSKIINWINLIYSIAIIEKDEVLASIIDHNTWKCIPALKKLFLAILTIEMQKIWLQAWEKEEIFSEWIFDKMISKIEGEMY